MPREYNRRYLPGTVFPRKTATKLEDSTRHLFRIGHSKIPGAGFGLFARVHIPKGTIIGIYRGIIMSKEDIDSKYGEGHDTVAPYAVVMQRPDGTEFYVDAQDANWPNSNWTRYINAPWGTSARPNVEMKEDGEFVTIRDLTSDCEILWNYGDSYFIDPEVQVIQPITNC